MVYIPVFEGFSRHLETDPFYQKAPWPDKYPFSRLAGVKLIADNGL